MSTSIIDGPDTKRDTADITDLFFFQPTQKLVAVDFYSSSRDGFQVSDDAGC